MTKIMKKVVMFALVGIMALSVGLFGTLNVSADSASVTAFVDIVDDFMGEDALGNDNSLTDADLANVEVQIKLVQAKAYYDKMETAERDALSAEVAEEWEAIQNAMREITEIEFEGQKGIWSVKCDIALPCATQNDISIDEAKLLVQNGVIAVGEGANMPCTNEALEYFLSKGILVAPAKAANAGGVATSALEMSQNSMRLSWRFDEVEDKLREIMVNIFNSAKSAAEEYGYNGNYVVGANIAGFLKVAEAMINEGVI